MRGSGAAHGVWRAGRVILAGAVIFGLLLLAPAVRPAPADAASGDAAVVLSVAACQPGDTITVTATGLGGPGTVPISLAGNGVGYPLGVATADSAGRFTATVTIPVYTGAGDYLVTVYDMSEATVSAPLHVGPPAAAATTAVTTDEATDAPAASAPPVDPDPVPEGARDIAFVLLVVGSLALAAWGGGPGRAR